jgi:S1-C subfamily serine protease
MTETQLNPPEQPTTSEPQTLPPPPPEPKHKRHLSPVVVFSAILLIGLVAGSLVGYSFSYASFNGKIDDLQTQLKNLPPMNATYVSYPNTTYKLGDNVSLADLYARVRSSVVVIQGLVAEYDFFGRFAGYGTQQGSGFVTLANNAPVIVTNNHVMENVINVTVTFANGDSYPATELGSDTQADLAVLSIEASSAELQPLTLLSSSTLSVGDPVVAVGSPYGLSGTLTTGVISALGRTITETSDSGATGPTIPDVIQTSTAINPGNSGGPLINYAGDVVGITTAGVSNSEGLGFAIPSGTIIREIDALAQNGSYTNHPTIDAVGVDMNCQIAQALGVNVTYGWLIESVSTQNGLEGGTSRASVAGVGTIMTGGDIIIAVNGTRITNTDDLLSYLEVHTLPGQTVYFTIVRDKQVQTVSVTIGKLS